MLRPKHNCIASNGQSDDLELVVLNTLTHEVSPFRYLADIEWPLGPNEVWELDYPMDGQHKLTLFKNHEVIREFNQHEVVWVRNNAYMTTLSAHESQREIVVRCRNGEWSSPLPLRHASVTDEDFRSVQLISDALDRFIPEGLRR